MFGVETVAVEPLAMFPSSIDNTALPPTEQLGVKVELELNAVAASMICVGSGVAI